MVVQPKPMVAGELVFGEDGRPSALFLRTSLILSHHRNKEAYLYCL